MVSKAINAENNEVIAENIPNAERIVRFPGGREIKVDYSAATGREKKITDAYGNETDYLWNPTNQFLKSTTDPAGRTTEFIFNSRGQRTSITRADGFKEDTTYDASGRLTGVTESAAGFTARTTTWTREASGKSVRKDYPDGSYETYTYNALGLVTEKRERNGSLTTRTYDSTGLMLTLTRAAGSAEAETTTFSYYAPGDPTGSPARLVKTESDPRGRTTAYEYNVRGQITKTTFPDGSFRAVSYDAFGNRISETDGVHTRSWTYNNYKQVTSATDPLGHVTRYYYGEGGIACGCFNNGGPTMIISPEGRLTLRSYDLEWRLARETVGHNTPEAATTEWLYDPLGNLAIKTLPGGASHSYGYDERNRATSETIKGGGLNLVTSRAYDPFGNVISETKPGGRATTKTYNLVDLPVTVTDALGTVTRYQYDPAENPIAVTRDANGPLAVTTAMAYDLLNRPVVVTNPDGTTAATSYHPGGAVHTRTDELGNVITTDDGVATWSDSKGGVWTSFVATSTDALDYTTSIHSPPMGRFAGVTMDVSPLGRVRESHRDACGLTSEVREGLTVAGSSIAPDVSITSFTYDGDHLRLIQTVDPGGLNLTTSFGYDARGNRLTVSDPLGRTTATQYDLRGNMIKTILPDSRQQLYSYDALNRKTSETDPKNQVITYLYRHETSQLSGLRDAKNQLTSWTHDALNQILTKSYPNGDTHVYTYDSLHRLKTHRTPKNETCTHSYDLRDRAVLDDWNTATPDTVREYFANGLLKKIDNGVAKSNYSYSVRNELLKEAQTSNGDTAVVSYAYDPDGLRTGMGSPSGSPVDYRWTARRQLADISRDGPPPFAIYSYDKAGRSTAIAHENGITEVKTYNAAGELLSNQHNGGSGMGHNYTYDLASRRTSETKTGAAPASSAFGYDAASQVSSADYGAGQTDTYAYDAMGNRITATVASLGGTPITYIANSVNQYTSISQNGAGTTPTYDANGNLAAANGVTYTWDSENRLLSVADGTTRIDHTYDGRHRRIAKKVTNLADQSVSSHIRFVYDGWNVIEEHSQSSALASSLLRTYTWGTDLSGTLQGAGGVAGLLLAEEIALGTTTAYHYHYDGNGNVTELTDLEGGSAATYRYDVFGNTIQSEGSMSAANRYRFSTKPVDDEIAAVPLFYFGYRFYDPMLGRWPSKDPIGERGGVNIYASVGNDWVNRTDHLGMCTYGTRKTIRVFGLCQDFWCVRAKDIHPICPPVNVWTPDGGPYSCP
jgi:RHS repeat-associated protein